MTTPTEDPQKKELTPENKDRSGMDGKWFLVYWQVDTFGGGLAGRDEQIEIPLGAAIEAEAVKEANEKWKIICQKAITLWESKKPTWVSPPKTAFEDGPSRPEVIYKPLKNPLKDYNKEVQDKVTTVMEDKAPESWIKGRGEVGKELGEKKDLSAVTLAKGEKDLSPELQKILLSTLKERFESNKKLHKKLKWSDVERALRAKPESLWSLSQLEITGGEPDVIGEDETDFVFGDCSKESPEGRRHVVFDKEAEEWLRKNSPDAEFNGNAADRVAEWGVDFMDETQYRDLQKRLSLDNKTWSWLKTPSDIRKAGNALNGYRLEVKVRVPEGVAASLLGFGGFRCALRVPKV